MVIVLELCEWKEFIPVILPLIHEELEVLFELLVDTFHLALSLWVVGGGCDKPNPDHLIQFLG